MPGYGVAPALAGARATAPAPTGKPNSPPDCWALGRMACWPSWCRLTARCCLLGWARCWVVVLVLGALRLASGFSPYPRGEPVGNRAASPKHCKRPVVHRRRREAAAARWVRAWPGCPAGPVCGDKPSGEGVAVGSPFLSVGKWWPGGWPLGQSQRDQGE